MRQAITVCGVVVVFAATLSMWIGGCQDGAKGVQDFFKTDRHRLLAPEKVIRRPPDEGMPINPILPSIGVVDQADELVPNATFPQMEDLVYKEEDYIIGPLDIIEVRILDLFQEGLETSHQRQVTETGYIDLPLVPQRVKATGLTKDGLIEVIKDVYSPEILLDPTVSVIVISRQQRTYSIRGAVASPSTYQIIRPDWRLMDALAQAGDIVQRNIRYIYVIRPEPAGLAAGKPAESAAERLPALPELPGLPEEAPRPEAPLPRPPVVPPAAPEEPPAQPPAPQTEPDVPQTIPEAPAPPQAPAPPAAPAPQPQKLEDILRELDQAIPSGSPSGRPTTIDPPLMAEIPCFTELAELMGGAAPPTTTGAGAADEGPGFRWTYTDGRWIRVPAGAPATAAVPVPAAATEPATEPRFPGFEQAPLETQDPFGWLQMDKTGMARIIAINLRQLNRGDPRMNIVIRHNDIILVPWLDIGEYYVMGEVARPGVYGLTGRRVTVKQAVTAAGNLNLLAWPENAILIRRVGQYQEQTIPLNIEAMFQGEEPDIYLKPDDLICVGTDVKSIFFAVVRNAFRMTYGFGFVYDRNFSDPLFFTPRSNRFTRL